MSHSYVKSINDKQSESQALSQETVEAFASLFRGRKDKSGWLRNEATANYVVLPNDKNPEPAPVTLDLYRYHLLGKRWLGIFPLVNDRCRFAGVDLDEENFEKALAFRNTLEQFGLKAYIAKTKSKGYRVIVFFIEPIIAANIIQVLNKVVGNPQAKIEVFPKQPYGTFKNPGNFFNLPSFGNRCPFLAGDSNPVPLDYVLDHVKYNTEEHLRRALEKIQKAAVPPLTRGKQPATTSQKLAHAPEEIVQMLRRPLAVGTRRPTLVKLAGYLRYRGIPEEVAVAFLLPWAEKYFIEPLSPEQVERHVHGIYQRYGLGESKLDKVLNSQALATILPRHKGKRRRN